MDTTYPLGRLLNHDPRSLGFPAQVGEIAKSVDWKLYAPVLNQEDLGSCTGNAAAQCLNSKPYHKLWSRYYVQADAVDFYSRATKLDPWDGEYPPTDTGSSGLAVAKALKNLGLISSYRHAFGLEHTRAALQSGPVLVGTNWYSSMFAPNLGWVSPKGSPVGGHEYLLVGDNLKGRLKFLNSWGRGWAMKGNFYMSYESFGRLLGEQGDATVLIK